MGTEAVIAGLFGLGGAAVSAASQHHTQAANAAAQSDLNRETMNFNRKEAVKARNWQASQAAIDRQFNSAQQVQAQNFNASQAVLNRNWATGEAALTRQFNSKEAAKARSWETLEAAKARSFNAEQALLTRQFEQRMSSTAHQREVQDLRNAGLNPILSATGGAGASTPSVGIVSSPLPSAVSATSGVPSGSAATSSALGHSGSGSTAAHISALNAYMKKDVLSQFVNSALESMRVRNDYMKAEAAVKSADAALKNAETNRKESIQRIEESISRVGLNYDEHELNSIRKMSEEERVKLVKEQITSEIIKRQDGHKLSEAQARAVEKSADAYAGLAGAQANLAYIRGQLETEKNPSVINELNKKAEEYESKISMNKWIMSDPKTLNERAFHEANPSNAGVSFASEVIGNIVHGAISFSSGHHSVQKVR